MFTTLSVRVARWHDNGAAGPRVVPGGQLKRGGGRGDYFPSKRLQIRRWCKQTYQATHITDWVSQLGEVTWYFGVWVFCSVEQCGGGTKADGQQKLKISITGVVAKLLYIYTWKSTCCSLVPLVSSDNPRDWNLEESRQAPFGHEFAGNVLTYFNTTGALQGSSGSVKGKIFERCFLWSLKSCHCIS